MANIHSKVSEDEDSDKQSGGGTDQCQTNTSACQLKSQEEDRQSSQPENGNIFVPHSDSELGLKLLNGQMCVEVSNWKCKFPSVIMKNHVCGNPKGGLEVGFCNEVIKIEFRIPPGFPDRMIGFMTVLQSLFLEPERLGITEIKIGRELVKQERHKAKDQECHVSWSSPRDRSGCRVSWIKESHHAMIKYKFSNINKIGVDEEMIMEVNESNEMYGKISSADPTTYGKWLAMPARIWLRTQWFMRNIEGIENDIFSKLFKPTAAVPPVVKQAVGQDMKSAPNNKNQKRKKNKHTKCSTPVQPDSVPVLEQSNNIHDVAEVQEVVKNVPKLTIDTGKSNKGRKHKRKNAHAKKDKTEHNTFPQQTEGQRDLADQETSTERHSASDAGQSTSPALSSPALTSPHLTSPFDTARTHLSPLSQHPSTPCSFATINTSPKTATGELEDAEAEEELEVEFAQPVSGAQGYFSDPEFYTEYRLDGLEADLPHIESPDAVRLGVFEGLRKVTSLTDQPSRAFLLHAVDNSELVTEASSDHDLRSVETASGESGRSRRFRPSKNKKDRARRRKRAAYTQSQKILAWYSLTYPDFSPGGWISPNLSPPETPEEELSPTGTQASSDEDHSVQAHWHFFDTPLPCAREGCSNQCSFMDGSTVVCPACGPFSLVRYCGKQHLWEDVLFHWSRCRCYPLLHQVVISSLPKEILMGPPMLLNIHDWDKPERHRQAVWFASAVCHGDYFLFDNEPLMDFVDQPKRPEVLGFSSQTNFACLFTTPEEKDRIRRVLAVCLFMAPEHPALVGYLYRLLRDWLISHDMLSVDMESVLANQLGLETGLGTSFLMYSELAGAHHACETEWYGVSHPCSNPQCDSDPPPVFLYTELNGFQELCDVLEGNFWLLRAHRSTHPDVRNMVDRIQGVGFEQAHLSERIWPRGEGWDGVGTGPMWVEESWSVGQRFVEI
ncbi:unnamed protein product [Penicillium salamii]|uniref:Uncharacterized protein n=1 Tax=Penicillium salamii TaxID=1612424 RepID=A0A9W4NUG0_9EURO|nr:unnamed protein product [Penicillium salamii]CAG8404110.1 unnamed protein product [Penicillium salamii]CAG8419668.1 unnamed protein product [Penicillium salamii]CAG8422045.1 unnamed protein product [Penicillium salamii]